MEALEDGTQAVAAVHGGRRFDLILMDQVGSANQFKILLLLLLLLLIFYYDSYYC